MSFFVSVLIWVPLFLVLSTLNMTFFLNVSERFLFVADLSEQSSAGRSKEQLPSPSGTKFIAPVHTNPVSHERY